MLGPKQEAQGALFYEFTIEDHVPQDHLLRSIDRFVDLSSIRPHLSEYRKLAEARPDAFTPDIAASLANLANMLSNLGQREACSSATSVSPSETRHGDLIVGMAIRGVKILSFIRETSCIRVAPIAFWSCPGLVPVFFEQCLL